MLYRFGKRLINLVHCPSVIIHVSIGVIHSRRIGKRVLLLSPYLNDGHRFTEDADLRSQYNGDISLRISLSHIRKRRTGEAVDVGDFKRQ